jgi:hypothetical protein
MKLPGALQAMFNAIADRFAATRRGSELTCGDCEQNERCGLPPHDDCPVKAAQIARDGNLSRAPREYYKAVWPR